MKKVKLTLFALSALLIMSSCGGGGVEATPTLNMKYKVKKDAELADMGSLKKDKATFETYPSEGTNFEFETEDGKSLSVFIYVLPQDLEAKKYALTIDDKSVANISFTLKADGKIGRCCNTLSSGSLTITEVDAGAAISGEVDLTNQFGAQVKGNFTAVPKH